MEVVLRGVRGGIAAPSRDMSFYGGNTACIEVRTDGGVLIFLDAGTGLREAGANLPDSGEANIFITHGHLDHIVGLWFFKPLHSPAWTTHLYLPDWLEPLADWFHRYGLFPVHLDKLKGTVVRHQVKAGETFSIGTKHDPVLMEAFSVNHPGGGLGWRVRADNTVLLYTGDHEITADPAAKEAAANMLRGADLAIVDAQYCRADYQPGFGHSAWEDWTEALPQTGLRRLVLSHHDPARSDASLDKLDKALLDIEGRGKALVGREGLRFTLGTPRLAWQGSDLLFQFLEELSGYRSESVLLDRILYKAREMTNADAGTIFLTEGNDLVFAYVHNDSLFPVSEAYRHAYTAQRIPISESSIAGYVAATGRHLNLPDVHALSSGVPYRFNNAFDRETGFSTKSILALPFLDNNGPPLGVLQLINSLHPTEKTPCPFTADMERDIRILAWEVSGILKCGMMERKGIYRTLRMVAVHDPFETGLHAERVGSIAAELYHVWAARRGHTPDVIRHEKGRIRMAAMLHDIGKVGVSDLVLKKPGKLTDEEFSIIRGHTTLGSSILDDDFGDIAALAHDIALHHHQKWNGRGYAGAGETGRLSGEAIPLGARITAIADVFDALVSTRCYKKPVAFADALDLLRKEAGEHFDPALVECMVEIHDLLRHIYERFPDMNSGGEQAEQE